MSISTFFGLETALARHPRPAAGARRHRRTTSPTRTPSATRRQEAMLAASPAFSYPSVVNRRHAGQLGTGVDVTAVPARPRRVRRHPAAARRRCCRATTRRSSDGLDQVELAFNEPGDTGLNSLLDKYWSRWQDVSNAPENMATRQALVQAAGALADGFQQPQLAADDDPVADRAERHRHDRRGQLDRPPDRSTLNDAIANADRGRRRAERPARPARRADRQARAARQRLDDRPAPTARSTSRSAAPRSSPGATVLGRRSPRAT